MNENVKVLFDENIKMCKMLLELFILNHFYYLNMIVETKFSH